MEINLPSVSPDFNSDRALGSINQLLSENVGHKISYTMSMNDGRLVTHTGIIYYVANSYVLIKTDCGYIAADIFSFKYACIY